LGLILAALIGFRPAAADTWKDYAYPSYGFSIRFPDKPTILNAIYTTFDGTSYPARLYRVERDNIEYKVTIADFSREAWTEQEVLVQAILTLAKSGVVKVDVPHRVRTVFGRQLSIAHFDGGHSSIAVFYYRKRLYQIQGTVLASNPDPASAEATRFQQSLQFPRRDTGASDIDPLFATPSANRPSPPFLR